MALDVAERGRFREVIASEAQLRELLGHPSHRVLNKVVPRLDEHCRRFIARSPFVVIASSGPSGQVDLSPRGDPAGFVRVLDNATLALPDRLGNRRIDTFCNIIENPDVGLIFLVPGKRETLRVGGKALIVRDPEVREPMAINGRVPDLALVVTVERAFFHCAKCMIRSRLWEPEAWPDLTGLPSLAEAMVAHGGLAEGREEMQAIIDKDARERLY